MDLTQIIAIMPRPTHLPGTALLSERGDLAELMVAGIQRYLLRATEKAAVQRSRYWHRDTSSPNAYIKSVEKNRRHLARIIGAQDPRPTPDLSYLSDPAKPLAKGPNYNIYPVRWRAFANVDAEGLLLALTLLLSRSVRRSLLLQLRPVELGRQLRHRHVWQCVPPP